MRGSGVMWLRYRFAASVVALSLAGCGEAPAPPRATQKPPAAARPPAPPAKPLEASKPSSPEVAPVQRDLDALLETKELRVLFTFNSTGYFVYRGDTMGYEYELLAAFAKDQKLRLIPVVVRDATTLFDDLARGTGDVVAAQLAAGRASPAVSFTESLYETSPVVVQRRAGDPTAGQPEAVATALERQEEETGDLRPITVRARFVERPEQLAGQEVHLSRVSPYRPRLLELNEELTNDIHVVEVDESSERLIQRLSEGEIAFTVAAENVAALRTGEFTNLIIRPAVGPPHRVVWAVRSNAPQLKAALDAWLETRRKSGLLRILYKKYFLDRRGFQKRVASSYLTAETGRLSPFDDAFREYARIPGWDWRLVASQAYQESRFDPNAKSWAGAKGVMQIMPRTARELRVNPSNPRQSIEGACRYLWKLDQRWLKAIPKESERVKFILASYNVGAGHVDDARRLAKKNGDDDTDWDDVAYWLVRKSSRAIYNDPVVKHGFARGTEPVGYVDQILDRYEHYRAFVTADE